MQAKTRTNQGGSVINFLIVGVVLAAIALGAIFFAGQRGKDVATGPKPSITASPSPSATPSPSAQTPSSSPAPSSSPKASPSSAPAVPPTGVLPSTGPGEELIVSSLPFVVIIAATAAYIQSRRATS